MTWRFPFKQRPVRWPSVLPTLIIHGDDDQIVPIGALVYATPRLIKHAILRVYSRHEIGL